MNLKALLLIILALTARTVLADTPPPGTVRIKDTAGNPISTTDGALDVNVASGTLSGTVAVSNFPSTNACTQSGAWSTGRTWALSSAGDSVDVGNFPSSFSVSNFPATNACTQSGSWNVSVVNFPSSFAISNFPATQPISGTVGISGSVPVTGTFWQATQPVSGAVSVSNFPSSQAVTGTVAVSNLPATQAVSGTVSVGNFPAVTAIDGGNTHPVVVDGSAVTQPVSGAVSVSNFPATQPVSGSVSVSNLPATQAISAAALPLPAGASTAANQATANGSLSSIDSKLSGTLLVDASAHAQPVTGTFWQATQPISGAVGANLADGTGNPITSSGGALNVAITSGGGSNPSVGPTGSAVPAAANFIAGKDGSGNLKGFTVGSAGELSVDGSAHTQPVSGSVSVSNFPSSFSVSNFPATQAVTQSGSWTVDRVWTLSSGTDSVNIGNFPATQAISAAALPLPAGASTAAKQPALGTAGTASSDVLTVQGIASMTALKVDGSAVTQPVSGSVSVSNFPATQPVSGAVSVSNFPATQPISAAALPLPTGAATAVAQGTANGTLASIDGKTPGLGQSTMAGSVPVTLASDQSAIPITGSITATNASVGVNGATAPSSSSQAGGVDGSGHLQALAIVTGGALKVDASATTQPVSGTVGVSGTVTVDGSGVTQPVSISGSVPVTGTFWQATQPVSGTVGVSGTVMVDGSGATQPISATALPLPTGASTAAAQATGNTSLASIASSVAGTLSVDGSGHTQPVSGTFWQATQPVSGTVGISGSVPVTGTFWQATQPVSASALPLPTGAATAANQSTANTSLASIDSKLPALGQVLMAGSLPVTLASDQSALPVTGTFWQATQPVSGSVSISNFPSSQAVTGTFWQSTQPVSAAALPLPSGAATAAKQPALGTAGSASSDVISVQGVASMTALKVDGSAVTQPVSGTVGISGSVPVTGTFWQATQPVSGMVGVSGTVTVNGSGVTQPVSAASLPLPSGAATAANQATAITSLSSIDSKVPSNLTVTSTRLLVDGSGVTQPVSGTVGVSGTVPVSGTFWQTTQPVSGSVTANVGTTGGLALDATVAALQVAQGSTTSGQSGPLAQASVLSANPTYTTGQTAPLSLTTTGGLRVATGMTVANAGSLPNQVGVVAGYDGTNVRALKTSSTGVVSVDGSAVTQPVSVAAAIPTKAPVNTNGNQSTVTTVGSSSATTLTVPSNAVGFVLEASSANAQNIRWAIGSAATTSSGLRLEPGRDTGYIPGAANISVIAESGTNQEIQVQWILSQ